MCDKGDLDVLDCFGRKRWITLSQNNLRFLLLQGFEDCIVFDDLLDKHKGDLGKFALFTKDTSPK